MGRERGKRKEESKDGRARQAQVQDKKTDACARQKTRRVWSKTGDAGQASPSVPLAHTSGPACTMAAREKWAARAHRPGRPAQFGVWGFGFSV